MLLWVGVKYYVAHVYLNATSLNKKGLPEKKQHTTDDFFVPLSFYRRKYFSCDTCGIHKKSWIGVFTDI